MSLKTYLSCLVPQFLSNQSMANLEVKILINKQNITNIDYPSQPSQCVFRFHQNLK